MAQRLSEQVVEWLTVGGDAFTPQNFNSTNGNIPLVISKPGESVTIPATNGTAIGIYNNKGQLWTLGAAAASTSVKSSQLIVSSSDSGNGSGVGIELWRGAYTSWQLLGSNGTDGIFYIGNNSATTNKATYDSNIALGYGAPANQYVHIYSTLDSSYANSVGGAALSVMGGITAAKKIYFADTTDSNYATKAGALVVEGGVNIAKKVYLRDTTDSSYATVAGSFVTKGGAYIAKKTYIADTTDSNYSTIAGSFVTMGGAYIKKKTYIADTTDSSSTSTGSFSTAGGASIAKKLYVGSNFDQTGDSCLIKSNLIQIRNKSNNNNQAGSYPYITSLTIGDGTEITLDEYKDGFLSIHSKSGILLYPQTAQPAVYNASSTYSVGTVVWYNKEYYRCTTAITEAQEWTAANWTKIPTANGATWSHGNINPTITNTYTLGTASYRWSKLYIGTADSYGSGTQPIYWNAGAPTASTSTVGSGVIPMYLSSGTLTASTSTVGSGVKPIYLSSGTLTVSSSSLGGTAQPVYMASGELKAISATVGTATKPVYLSSGIITVGTYELKATVNYEVNAKINSGTANQVAYYSGTNEISSKAPAWSAWTAGTTAGPKANIQIGNATYTSDAIPSASASASGIVTTGNQTFAGRKTIDLISPSIYDGTTNTSRYKHLYYKNNAGTMVGEIEYDSGNATNVSSGKFYFTEMSPKSTADTATTGYYETYALPTVTSGRTANATYEILTTKSHAAPSQGTAKQVAYYSAAGTISGNSNLTIDGTTLSIGGYGIGPAAGTYGTIDCMTAKGSYYGITSGPGNDYLTLMSHTGKQHQGLYNTAKGKWAFYYDATNNRVGIGTSSCTSGYMLTVSGSATCTGSFYVQDGISYIYRNGEPSLQFRRTDYTTKHNAKIYLQAMGEGASNSLMIQVGNASGSVTSVCAFDGVYGIILCSQNFGSSVPGTGGRNGRVFFKTIS